jgi:hypothetical protein
MECHCLTAAAIDFALENASPASVKQCFARQAVGGSALRDGCRHAEFADRAA